MDRIKQLSIKLLNFSQKLNDWCFEHDDGRNFNRILELQLKINEARVEYELYENEDYLQ